MAQTFTRQRQAEILDIALEGRSDKAILMKKLLAPEAAEGFQVMFSLDPAAGLLRDLVVAYVSKLDGFAFQALQLLHSQYWGTGILLTRSACARVLGVPSSAIEDLDRQMWVEVRPIFEASPEYQEWLKTPAGRACIDHNRRRDLEPSDDPGKSDNGHA